MNFTFMNPWTWLIAGLVVLLAYAGGCVSGAVWVTGKATESALEAQAKQFEVDRKADQAAAAKNLQTAVKAMAANSKADVQLAEQVAASLSIMERVNRAPRSSNCVSSPAVRVYLDGLRGRTPN